MILFEYVLKIHLYRVEKRVKSDSKEAKTFLQSQSSGAESSGDKPPTGYVGGYHSIHVQGVGYDT